MEHRDMYALSETGGFAADAEERDAILRRWAGPMPREGDLARAMALQQDKPLAESRGEIDYTASFSHRFREEAKHLWGKTIPSHLSGSPLTVVPAV
jgi:aspartate-semialdehyde dehydrogenase